MAINSIGYGSTVLGQSVRNLNDQLTTLSAQLTTGKKATTYAGMGVNEGFAIAARAQLSNISAFTDTMTKINTTISVANTALQSLVDIGSAGAERRRRLLAGAQQLRTDHRATERGGAARIDAGNSQHAVRRPLHLLRRRDRHAFGDRRRYAVERQRRAGRIEAGDSRTPAGRSRQRPRPAGDFGAGHDADFGGARTISPSVFGLKLNSVSSSLTGATVTGPTGSPPAVSINVARQSQQRRSDQPEIQSA